MNLPVQTPDDASELGALDPWRWRWLLLVVAVFAIDQATKWVVVSELFYGERIQVLSFFAWVRWHNTGAAFSFLADAGGWQRWFFLGIGFGFCAYILRELSRLTQAERWMGLVYGLIMGGALGNLYDRAVNGYVVDFILLHYQPAASERVVISWRGFRGRERIDFLPSGSTHWQNGRFTLCSTNDASLHRDVIINAAGRSYIRCGTSSRCAG